MQQVLTQREPQQPRPTRTSLLWRLRLLTAVLLLSSGVLVMAAVLVLAAPTASDRLPFLLLMSAPPLAGVLAIYGLLRCRTWGRWLGLAIGVCGSVFFTLGTVLFGELRLWTALLAGAFVLLTCLLSGRSMASGFGRSPFLASSRQSWLLTWGAILALAALPALGAFALAGSPHGLLRVLAAVAAAAILGGSVLLLAGRTAGALLVIAGGLPTAWVMASHLRVLRAHGVLAFEQRGAELGLALCCWGLALLGAALILAALARPIWRALRG